MRLKSIDGARACASLAVILCHIYLSYYQHQIKPPRWMDTLSPLGHFGVSLFLILSGFCISNVFVRSGAKAFDLKDFLVRRIIRIVPAYTISITAVLAVMALSHRQIDVWEAVTHLTLTHNLIPRFAVTMGPYWTVALEMQLYILFALAMVASLVIPKKILLYLGFGAWGVWRLVMFIKYGTGYTAETFSITFSVFGRILEFLLGVVTARYWEADRLRSLVQSHEKTLSVSGLLLVIVWLVFSSKIGPTNPLGDLLLCSGIVILFNLALHQGTWLGKLLSLPGLVKVGESTYSTYLYHCLVIKFVGDHLLRRLPLSMAPVYLVVLSVISIVAGHGAYVLIEKKIIDMAAIKLKKTSRRPVAIVL